MNNKNKFLVRGSVGLMAIIAVALLMIGGGAYFAMKKSPEQKVAEVEQAASDIGASLPSLDFSLSSLPDLEVSSLNVAAPQISTGNVFSAPLVNTDFSYDTSNINIAAPSISADSLKFDMPSIPKNIPSATVPTGGSTVPSGGTPSASSIDCSAFAMAPSCSYVPAGQARDTCKQCFPNK
ncbi:MAG: hypothetical protein AAB626_01260 [Patescibacteria group bacterium]